MKLAHKTADKELKIIKKTRKYMTDKFLSETKKKIDIDAELRMSSLLFSFTILEACLAGRKDTAIDALEACTDIVKEQLISWSEETISH